jgi:hypothetical protein
MNKRLVFLLTGFCGLACAASAATSACTLAYFNLAGVADGERVATAVASIDAAPGFDAVLADRPGVESWRTLPADVEPGQWLSLVKVKFGQQCDFLLFRFADRDGTVAYAGRRPSRVREVKYYYSVPPGPDQIPENAIRETATDYVFRQSNETARARPPLQITVEAWAEAGGPGAEPGGSSMRIDVLEAMAYAAAYEAGWQPTAAKAAASIRLSAREEMGLFIATRAVPEAGGAGWLRRNIPREAFYDHLARLFFRLRQPAVILESAAFGSRDEKAIGWREGRVILASADGFKAVQPASGLATAVSSNDAALPAPGRLRVEAGRTVTAVDPAGKALWSYDPGEFLVNPPVELEGAVVVAAKNGSIAVLDAATGAVRVQRAWPTWLLGIGAIPSKNGVLVACTDLRRRLTLLRADDLKPVREVAFPWALAGPVFHGDRVPLAWALSAAGEPDGLVAEMETTSAPGGPAVLVQDKDGFLHAVAIPAE